MSVKKLELLNIEIDNLALDELLSEFDSGFLVTPNVDHLVRLQKDRDFYSCYQAADYIVCDSRIIYLLTRIFFGKKRLKAQITGSDFFPAFCKFRAESGADTRIFLLGGTETSVHKAMHNINSRLGREIVVDAYSPPFGFEKDETVNNEICNLIRNSTANVLAVGVGSPKQEKWIVANKDKLPNIRAFLAVGATIEFESHNLKRAPKWMTKYGLEWLYRLRQEPKRLAKRYLIHGPPFFFLFFKQLIGSYRNPWT